MGIRTAYNVWRCVKSYRDKLNDKRHPCCSPTTSLLIEMTLDDGVCVCVCVRNDNTVNIPHALSDVFTHRTACGGVNLYSVISKTVNDKYLYLGIFILKVLSFVNDQPDPKRPIKNYNYYLIKVIFNFSKLYLICQMWVEDFIVSWLNNIAKSFQRLFYQIFYFYIKKENTNRFSFLIYFFFDIIRVLKEENNVASNAHLTLHCNELCQQRYLNIFTTS